MALIQGDLCDICNKFFPRLDMNSLGLLPVTKNEAIEHAKIPTSIPYPVGLLLKNEKNIGVFKEDLCLILVRSIHSYDEEHVANYLLESFVPSKEYRYSSNALPSHEPYNASGIEMFSNQQWSLLTQEELELHKPYIIQELQRRNEDFEKFGGKAMPIPELVITYEKKNSILQPV